MYYSGDSIEIGSKKALMGALKLYLDFINLFIFYCNYLDKEDKTLNLTQLLYLKTGFYY